MNEIKIYEKWYIGNDSVYSAAVSYMIPDDCFLHASDGNDPVSIDTKERPR